MSSDRRDDAGEMVAGGVHAKSALHADLVAALGHCTGLADAGVPCSGLLCRVGRAALRFSDTAGDNFHKVAMSAFVAAVLGSESVRSYGCGRGRP